MLKPAAVTSEILKVTELKEGKEIYSTARTLQPQTSARLVTTVSAETVFPSHPEEEDDLSVEVTPGMECRHKGCRVIFMSDAENRIGNGEGTVCTYHPAPVRFGFLATFTDAFISIDRINPLCSPSSTREARCVALQITSLADCSIHPSFCIPDGSRAMSRDIYAVKGESWNLKNSLRSKDARKDAMFLFRSRMHWKRWCVHRLYYVAITALTTF